MIDINDKMNILESEFQKICEKIGVDQSKWKIHFRAMDMGYPHIEFGNDGYLFYIITERGKELSRRKTKSIDEIMYWMFSDITSSMSYEYEMNNRNINFDSRKISFDKKIELLSRYSLDWANREKIKQNKILEVSPFRE